MACTAEYNSINKDNEQKSTQDFGTVAVVTVRASAVRAW